MLKKLKISYVETVLGALVIAAATPKRLLFPLHGLFAFTYDQGRDLLAVQKIIESNHPVLIGPTTGVSGIFYGPWWYYFLLPIFYLSRGDPQKIALVFSVIGIITVLLIFLLLKILTKNIWLSFGLSIVAAFSQNWMLGPTNIWSPTLTPIFLICLIFAFDKIFESKKIIYYFLLGVFAALAFDTTASLHVVMAATIIILPIFYRKYFLNKNFLCTLFGFFLIISPRIIFEIRNHFLMTKTFRTFILNIGQGKTDPFLIRFQERISQLFNLFSVTFAREKTTFAILAIIFIIAAITIGVIWKRKELVSDKILSFLLIILVTSFIFFLFYPQSVWDYYLVALPLLWLVFIAKLLSHFSKFPARLFSISLVIFLILINFQKGYLPPYKITWEGDGGTYNNIKKVIDFLSNERPSDYSLFSFSPARFDYPVDYLIGWYGKRELLETPKENQKILYLIIRDGSSMSDFRIGWYSDKTRGSTKLIYQKQFPGDILLEKHERLE